MALRTAIMAINVVSIAACTASKEVELNPADLNDTSWTENPALTEKLGARFQTFGSAYVDGDGVTHVFLTDTSQRRMIDVVLDSAIATPITRVRPTPKVVYHDTDFSYVKLKAWRDTIYDRLMGIPGLVGVDVSNRCNCVAVTLAVDEWVDETRRRISASDVPKRAVKIRIARFTPLQTSRTKPAPSSTNAP